MVKLISAEESGPPMFFTGASSHPRTDASGRFTIDGVTSGTYTLLAIAPVVTATAGGDRRSMSFGVRNGLSGASIAPGVMTETSNGVTVEYRDDKATRVPLTVAGGDVAGLEVVVRTAVR